MEPDVIVPLAIFAVPIVAIVGGITVGITRAAGQQRMLELAQRERIAAIERGIDPSKLPPLPQMVGDLGSFGLTPEQAAKRRAQSLTIGGLVTTFSGVGIVAFLNVINVEHNVWAVGLIPVMAGLALLLSAWIIWPRNGGGASHPGGPPAA